MRRSPDPRRSGSSADADHETVVSRWFADYAAAGRAKTLVPVRTPRRTLAALRSARRLPLIPLETSAAADGVVIRDALRQPWTARLLLGHTVSALPLPACAADYLVGRPKHPLRQKVRAAAESGVRYRRVDDPAERAALMRRADLHERTESAPSTRNSSASNLHLVPLRYWLVAEGPDGEPLLLAVVAVDHGVALLRYYRTLVSHERASVARFGAMPHLVEAMVEAGVRVLFEAGRPYLTDNGIRQFQRKLGFRLVRTSIGPTAQAPREQLLLRRAPSPQPMRPTARPVEARDSVDA